METKICTKCHQELPLNEFYSNGKGGFRSECKNCHSKYVTKAYISRKEKVSEIKAEIGCQKCGEKRTYCLDFHHKDPSIKEATIARITSDNNHFDKIQEEIDKCIVLCANCHREFHHLQKLNDLTIEEYIKN